MPNSYAVRIATLVPIALAVVLAVGCNTKTAPTPENYTQALNAYLLNHNGCLLPDAPRFPFETSDPAKTKQLDALVESQLLTRATEPSIHASRYTVTPIGASPARAATSSPMAGLPSEASAPQSFRALKRGSSRRMLIPMRPVAPISTVGMAVPVTLRCPRRSS